MKVHMTSSKGGILLLTGPSGCGKTATVLVLCRELGFRIQEWINPTNMEPYDWRTNGFSGFSCGSQVAQFQEFLLRANKYSCLRMAGDDGATDRKLILVEDLPNQFYRQPGSLHSNLRQFMKTSRCPLVFIVSDSLSGDSSSRFLFPRDIQEELDISSISFNPVAPTTAMKVLTRISTLEAGKSCGRMDMPDKGVLEMLCSGSSGDIRSAINSLQFSSLPGSVHPHTSPRLAICVSRQTKEQEEVQAIGGKDASLFLFRALGKILHCKRQSYFPGSSVASGPGLSSHLSHHLRETLLVDPELVVERSHMSGGFFNLYLHQNYLDFFSEVEDVARASEYLSDSDLLTADWTVSLTRLLKRCILYSWNSCCSRQHRENCLAAQSLFRSFCLTPVSLQTDLLPYLAKLSSPMRNQAQIAFIQDVGQMSQRRFSSRLKLEALTDKELGQLETDVEEEEEQKEEGQGGAEEGLPDSQPQPNTSQVLLEELDLIIEEYLSD
uniref:AAA+ ATPase domain-containing protein n=1 Tax=Scophthalmus maximus TaxID=52904 RepID=A0A8D3C1X6_SCOMX